MDKRIRVISHLIFLPAVALAQIPKPIPAQQPLFEVLSDSQWIRVSSTGQAPREARLLEHSTTEVVLDLEPHPLRIRQPVLTRCGSDGPPVRPERGSAGSWGQVSASW
jgi:hypothetical protein